MFNLVVTGRSIRPTSLDPRLHSLEIKHFQVFFHQHVFRTPEDFLGNQVFWKNKNDFSEKPFPKVFQKTFNGVSQIMKNLF
jgi:hypothetical protein